MTNEEIEELRHRLAQAAAKYDEDGGYIIDTVDHISSTDALALTSEAELQVFSIPRELVPELQTAYAGYLVLEDIVVPSFFDKETTELIEKAQSIVPPIKSFGRDIPFEAGMIDDRFFMWFAKTFMDIPNRHAAAIYAKHEFNAHEVARFADEW
jgi:hypothetical protein